MKMGYNKTQALGDVLQAEAITTIRFLFSEGISVGEALSPHQGWTTGIGWDADVELIVAELLGKKKLSDAEEAVYFDHYIDAIRVEEKEVIKEEKAILNRNRNRNKKKNRKKKST